MNINELVHCWLLATDKKECRVSELFRVPDGFPEGLGHDRSLSVTSQVPVATHTGREKKTLGTFSQGSWEWVQVALGRVPRDLLPWQMQQQRKLAFSPLLGTRKAPRTEGWVPFCGPHQRQRGSLYRLEDSPSILWKTAGLKG